MERLFFAVHPDAAAAAAIEARALSLRRELGLKGRPVARERSHLTLLFVGSFGAMPTDLPQQLTEAVRGLAPAPFVLRLDRVVSFNRRPHKRPIVLLADPAGPAGALHAALAERLNAAGLAHDAQRHFLPHLTLLYDDLRVDQRPVEPVEWTVREFSLMQSLVGRSTHLALARWPMTKEGG